MRLVARTFSMEAVAGKSLAALIQETIGLPLDWKPSKQMLIRQPVGGAIEGRPWTECGYGLGIMTGSMGHCGRAIGHSGAGPFCVNAVYHFPDRDNPITVASFTSGCNEGRAEFEATKLAESE